MGGLLGNLRNRAGGIVAGLRRGVRSGLARIGIGRRAAPAAAATLYNANNRRG